LFFQINEENLRRPDAYQFKVWHEAVGYLERKLELEIKAGETTEAKLVYPAERFKK